MSFEALPDLKVPNSGAADRPLVIRSTLVAAGLIGLPIVIAYCILFTHIVNIPIADDYDAILNFSLHLRNAPTFSEKLYYLLSSQHNEYKLFFEHALFWLQLELFGHIDLTLLCVIGDSFIVLLGIVLWKMFLPQHQDRATRVAFFIPVSWLLFQLQYAQTLNFAMAALQNLPVLVFSLGAICLLHRATLRSFVSALACLVLAVSSSGNGLLVIPIGLIILILNRSFRRAFIWATMSALCIAAYWYGYSSRLWVSPSDTAGPLMAQFLRPVYIITFVGSAGGYPIKAGSFFAGILICAFYFYLAKEGYFRRNPAIGYSVLFLLLSGVLVAGFRSNFGISSSIASRYTIYSTLLLIFGWFAIVEEWLIAKAKPPLRNRILATAIVLAVVFSAAMDVWGSRFLRKRNQNLVTGMMLYQHSASKQIMAGPSFPPPRSKGDRAFNLWTRDLLRESEELGIYRPPSY